MKVQAQRNFCANLRAAMDSRGISQRDMADMAKVSYPYVNRVLTGKVAPSLQICDRFADALGLTLSEMLVLPREFKESLLQHVS